MRPTTYDTELRRHHEVLRRAAGVRPGDDVLDIGCGGGQTAREAARVARSVLGVDVSAAAIERARARTDARGARFEVADAQVHGFAPASFDLAVSRFGTMFFADPVAAFANIARALRPAGRLVMMVWQAGGRNEWDVAVRGAVTVAAGGPDPFSLADPGGVTAILEAAGFGGVTFTEVSEPVCYGPDVAAALDWVHGFAGVSADPSQDERLREVLEEHLADDGVWFDSRAWVVSALKKQSP